LKFGFISLFVVHWRSRLEFPFELGDEFF
jgi:hypothetical protein